MRYWVLAALLVGSLLLLEIGQRVHMITLGIEIEQLQGMHQDLRRSQKELLIERETLSALDRIEKIAHESLGMTKPGADQIVYVDILPEGTPPPEKGPAITLVRN